ncbi:hypothetical protein WA158_003821 [Blastocystis sp. Blastoise]
MWKKFNFFQTELLSLTDNTKPFFGIQALDVTSSCSYQGTAFFGDSEGGITFTDRKLQLNRVQAFDYCLNFMYHYVNAPVLVTVGDGPDIRDSQQIEEAQRITQRARENLACDSDNTDLLQSFHIPTSKPANPLSNYTIKIWNTEIKDGIMKISLVNSYKLFENDEHIFHCMTVYETSGMVVFGLENGGICLLNGNIRNQKCSPMFLIPQDIAIEPVTNIFSVIYIEDPRYEAIYITTATKTGLFIVHTENRRNWNYKDVSNQLGCKYNCATLSSQQDLILGEDSGLYFFSYEDQTNCYIFKGEKLYFYKYKNCLLVESLDEQKRAVINIYNLTHKFIEKTMGIQKAGQNEYIIQCLHLQNTIYILTQNHNVYILKENSLQSKLNYLYENKLYLMAIDLAKQNQMDEKGVKEIYKIYGDYLYEQGDYENAMQQYLQTIGYLEPSYVIKKYLEASTIASLTQYLEKMHKFKKATSDHTTLLINCYSKLREVKKIQEFIYNKDKKMLFDVPTAINVLRNAGYYEEAVYLAGKNNINDIYLSIQIEDLKEYLKGLQYISSLNRRQAIQFMLFYGKLLLKTVPKESIELIIELCTEYTPHLCEDNTDIGSSTIPTVSTPRNELSLSPLSPVSALDDELVDRGNPDDFISCFTNDNDLEYFLEQLLLKNNHYKWDSIMWNTLLELYLKRREKTEKLLDILKQDISTPSSTSTSSPAATPSPVVTSVSADISITSDISLLQTNIEDMSQEEKHKKRDEYEQLLKVYEIKIMDVLQREEYTYDDDQALLLVQMYRFHEGQIYLYHKLHMYSMILQYYIEIKDTEQVIEFCKEHGKQEPSLWINLLTYFSSMDILDDYRLKQVLLYIEENHIMPALSVLEALGARGCIPLSVVKEYILKELEETKKQKSDDLAYINELLFQQQKCLACNLALDLPSVHFMCGHSFHQHCVGDRREGCPKCAFDTSHDEARELLKLKNKSEDYLNKLPTCPDGFLLSAEYISKGIFQELNHSNQTETNNTTTPPSLHSSLEDHKFVDVNDIPTTQIDLL